MTDRDYAVSQFRMDMEQAADMLRMQLDGVHHSAWPIPVQSALTMDTLIEYLATVQTIYAAYTAKRNNIVYIYDRSVNEPGSFPPA